MKNLGWEKLFVLAVAASLALTIVAGRFSRREDSVQALAQTRLPSYQLILDAGHGGEDGGAVSITGVPESQINLAVTLKLDQLFGLYGISPVVLRSSDISLHDDTAKTIREKKISDLYNRVSAIESTENALVVSIHQNTFADPSYHGAQTFYRAEGESQALAKAVQETLKKSLEPENRRKAAKISNSVYLMKHITCPAVLVECGFLSNVAEEAKLCTGRYQTQLALCIAGGVLQYENSGSQQGKDVL